MVKKSIKKEKIGKVISNKCNKSVVVEVDRILKHFLYGKFIKKTTRFMVHDKNNLCKLGDIVKIIETRPISKNKKWKIFKIYKKNSS